MKLHCFKDYLAIFLSSLGLCIISYDKCNFEQKVFYYKMFLLIIVLIDGFFVFNKYAYDYDLKNNLETKVFFSILTIPSILFIYYIYDCII
jgi:hypothetical protein